MVSAGDHERLPKKDDENGEVDLTHKKKKFRTQKVPEKWLKRLRKGIKKTSKFKTLEEIDGDVEFIAPKGKGDFKSPVKGGGSSSKDFIDMARKGVKGIKLKKPIKKVKKWLQE